MTWFEQLAVKTFWLIMGGYALICWCARKQEYGR